VLRNKAELPFPPQLAPRMNIDGYLIVRELHASARSHVFLATDPDTNSPVVIKILATDMREDAAHLERFLMEDWVAQRIDNPHVARAAGRGRQRNYLYTVSEFVDGQTLHQWIIDNPKPALETVRRIVEQIANGLLAFHRLDMLHQDLRPQNVMIDRTGTARIIDFGSTRVAGIAENALPLQQAELLGTVQYMAPEYFLGEGGDARSDLYSLGVIAYQMLSGRLPYGAEVARARTRAAQRQLRYDSVLADDREIPAWVDEVLRKAVHPDPNRRYAELSEFVYDLRHPNAAYLSRTRAPLLERNPVAFWRGAALLLAAVLVYVLLK
jgi:serine/threonine protein kinase